jgi:CheY-like chemotaxis protein
MISRFVVGEMVKAIHWLSRTMIQKQFPIKNRHKRCAKDRETIAEEGYPFCHIAARERNDFSQTFPFKAKGNTMSNRILVVDDDQTICDLLQEVLEEEAYEVDTASDGLIAWEKLVQKPGSYKAILLDIRMPRLDGLQLLQILREQQQISLPSVVVLSSDYDGIQQAIGMGACHALEKPFDLEAILAMVSEIGQKEEIYR